MNEKGRAVSVFACQEELTRVRLGRSSLLYEAITTVMYVESLDYRNKLVVSPRFAVSLTDDMYGGFFRFIDPNHHQTSDIGRCGCLSGVEGKKKERLS